MGIIKKPFLFKEMNRLKMDISEIAYAKLDTSWRNDFAKAPFTRIYYVTRGTGLVEYSDGRIELKPGSIYVLPAESEFSYRCESFLEKLYFHVNLLRADQSDLLAKLPTCVVLKNREAQIAQALECWERGDNASIFLLKTMLYQTVCEAIAQTGADFGRPEDFSPIVARALSLIQSNLHAGLTARRIAEKLYLSESLVQKRFKQEIGIPLGKYCQELILREAERRLRMTSQSIQEVSDGLGFCDPFYFSRSFKRRYGVPPSQYRKNLNLELGLSGTVKNSRPK